MTAHQEPIPTPPTTGGEGSTAPNPAPEAEEEAEDRLSLADWRRRIADLYGAVRAMSATDPEAAWRHWRETREWLFREHPQSPVPAAERPAFEAHHWPYDPSVRFELPVIEDGDVEKATGAESASGPASGPDRPSLAVGPIDAGPGAGFGGGPIGGFGAGPIGGFGELVLPISTGGEQSFSRIGWLEVPFTAGPRRLGLYWMAGYAGGLFLPFRDATNGNQTYGAGRYLLDAAKSADLGGDVPRKTLILDFNFAFHPSCAFDPKWSCPLSPTENRLDLPVEAGERLI